jgi:6-pyruvoyltetrahydropterin/6-carboxytetrahydropterin synthase
VGIDEMMIVAKRVEIDAAHFLPGYDGKCANLHGHRWIIEIGIKGYVDEKTGMVVDFTLLKAFLDTIKEKLDHHLINDIIPNPTAENLCMWVRYQKGLESIENWNPPRNIAFIRVWETEDSYAELS